VLVTGGAGYIGSHCCVELLAAGHEVVVVDSLVNSDREALARVERLAGRPLVFHQADLCDAAAVARVLDAHPAEAVVHFAGLKAVGESVAQPLRYYANNVGGTLVLLEAMRARGLRRLVFSSSATVYGEATSPPFAEDAPLAASNPYGRTKLLIEEICRDLARAEPGWHVALLRYFNPVGAHPSGLIGEDPAGIPNNLMPYLLQVAAGRRERLRVFGADYPTPDGTGVRDYIHVVDLVRGHLAALERLDEIPGCAVFNLGTGRGHSVLEVVAALSRVVGRPLPYEIVERRPGDVAASWADPDRAARELGWRARLGLEDMCRDGWRWQSRNPHGYRRCADDPG
jgi:UDP-glucose 4-epimerase